MRDPKHILITGASSGLGAALVWAYSAPGICLSLHGRHAERLSLIADHARRKGAQVSIHLGDVADKSDMQAWIESADAAAGVDLIIANAGISAGTHKGGESAEQIAALFAANVSGVFNTIQPALPLMTKRGRGQIAIISSIAGFRGFAGAPAYCASKAAVRVYGEGLRGEMASQGVEVNIVCPGFIKTPMTDVNPFPMPFMMSAEKAALIIQKGLKRNRARITFPWPTYFLARLLAALPQPIIDLLAAYMPKK